LPFSTYVYRVYTAKSSDFRILLKLSKKYQDFIIPAP
jgi:hypothetical protein